MGGGADMAADKYLLRGHLAFSSPKLHEAKHEKSKIDVIIIDRTAPNLGSVLCVVLCALPTPAGTH